MFRSFFRMPGGKEVVLVDDQRHQLRRQVWSGSYVVADLAAAPRRTILPDAVALVPRPEVLPAQAHLQRERDDDLPVVVDERREGRRRVGRARAAERAGARRAVAEQEVGDRVAR